MEQIRTPAHWHQERGFTVLEGLLRRGRRGDRSVEADEEDFPPRASRPTIGVALSGGAARGFAHIGVLQTLVAHGLKPDVIAATSMGAVIGGCYAAGLLEALRASYALPGVFAPVRVGGRWLLDGALVNPVPVSAARALDARLVIGVNTNADLFCRGATIHSHGFDEDELAIEDAVAETL